MKLKELEKTVTVAWSPKHQYPILFAAGTAAQQVDASFSTSAELELFTVDLSDPSVDLQLRCSVPSDCRFHKIIWGDAVNDESGQSSLLVGGCDAGRIVIYNTSKLLKNELVPLQTLEGHSGAVKSLDFNHFQKNLLATGASRSEIFIWDMNNLGTPMAPGKAIEPLDDIVSVAWNKQVQHILTTTFSTKCLVWDLKKNEPIIKLTDPTSKSRWKMVTWDPRIATQLCLASEDDHHPVVQLWDLRYATSPVKVLEGHQKGVLSVAWCDDDPDLLMSCGKDNKLLVWNANSSSQESEIVCDIPLNTHWNFESSWCPRNPFLISTSSFDGRSSIYSLSGGHPTSQTANKIAGSFPGVNSFSTVPVHQITQHQQPTIELLKPPKWMKRPCGVSFGFGGKLVSFIALEKTIFVSQVVTEPNLMLAYKQLENVLEHGNIFNHCFHKVELSNDTIIKEVWKFVASQMYGSSFKEQAITLLGSSHSELHEKLKALNINISTAGTPADESQTNISRIGPADGAEVFDSLVRKQNSSASSVTDGSHDFEILKNCIKFPQNDNIEAASWEALILGNIETAVDLLVHQGKWTDALVLSQTVGLHLFEKTKERYFRKTDSCLTALIAAIINEDWYSLVENCDLSNWKQVLITLLTFTKDEALYSFCAVLGHRLMAEGDETSKKNALICFILAADVNALIEHWDVEPTSPSKIHELVELGLIMKETCKSRGIVCPVSGSLANITVKYAELLASQGYLPAAYNYLGESNDEKVQELKHRLMFALELKTAYQYGPQTGRTKGNISYDSNLHPHQSNIYPAAGPVRPPSTSSVSSIKSLNKLPPPLANHFTNTSGTTDHFPTQSRSQEQFDGYNGVKYVSHGTEISAHNLMPNHQPFAVGHQTAPAVPPMGYPTAHFANSLQPESSQIFANPNRPRSDSVFSDVIAPTTPPFTARPQLPIPPPAQLPMPPSSATPPAPVPPSTLEVSYNKPQQVEDHVASSTRNKYVVDPSVQGRGSSYGNYSSGGYHHTMANQPQQFGGNSIPMIGNQFQYPLPNAASSYGTDQQNGPCSVPNLVPNQNMTTASVPVAKIGSQPTTAGWNDPPPFLCDRSSKNQTVETTVSSYSAISTPFPTPVQPITSASMPPTSAANYPQAMNNYQNQVLPNNIVANEAVPKAKPPLPEEHIHMQTIFDELQNQCLQNTNNLQMKRKLHDVSKKLDMLYDSIRENKLSRQTLSGLHEIVSSIQHHNYMNCLELHMKLIDGPDFASISSFMPGIKVLLQCAVQLQVYL